MSRAELPGFWTLLDTLLHAQGEIGEENLMLLHPLAKGMVRHQDLITMQCLISNAHRYMKHQNMM